MAVTPGQARRQKPDRQRVGGAEYQANALARVELAVTPKILEQAEESDGEGIDDVSDILAGRLDPHSARASLGTNVHCLQPNT